MLCGWFSLTRKSCPSRFFVSQSGFALVLCNLFTMTYFVFLCAENSSAPGAWHGMFSNICSHWHRVDILTKIPTVECKKCHPLLITVGKQFLINMGYMRERVRPNSVESLNFDSLKLVGGFGSPSPPTHPLCKTFMLVLKAKFFAYF
jgi:hypothetical protein